MSSLHRGDFGLKGNFRKFDHYYKPMPDNRTLLLHKRYIQMITRNYNQCMLIYDADEFMLILRIMFFFLVSTSYLFQVRLGTECIQ